MSLGINASLPASPEGLKNSGLHAWLLGGMASAAGHVGARG